MSKTVCASSISPPPVQKDLGARLAASVQVDQVEGTISQSILKSSSRALLAGDLSGISVHRNPGGAGGAWGDGAAGSLNRASEIPSLTPALIAEYSTQYVSSIPMAAAMNGNSSPNPINPTAASPSLEAADLRTTPHRAGARGTISRIKARWKREWAEVGPFIGAALLGLLLDFLEVLIFVGIPIVTIAVVVVFAVHFFRVAA